MGDFRSKVIDDCPDHHSGVHSFETVGAEAEGHGSMTTAVYRVCRRCGGVKREERPLIKEGADGE